MQYQLQWSQGSSRLVENTETIFSNTFEYIKLFVLVHATAGVRKCSIVLTEINP